MSIDDGGLNSSLNSIKKGQDNSTKFKRAFTQKSKSNKQEGEDEELNTA